MPEDERSINERLSGLEETLLSIEKRLVALEATGPALKDLTETSAQLHREEPVLPTEGLVTPETVKGELTRLPYLIGRTFLVFCGAFILRALTESATLAPLLGVTLGLIYGLVWLALSYRSTQQSGRLAALFHGITGVMITYPLLFEAATRLKVIPEGITIACVAALTLVSLAIATLSQQRILAWTVTLAAMAVTVALLISTHQIADLAISTLVIGIASLWISERSSWHAIRWPVAVVADVLVLQMTSTLTREGGPPEVFSNLEPGLAIAIALALVVVYAGGLALGTLQQRRTIQPFEVIQTAVVILVGFGGAFRLASVYSVGAGALLITELIVAAVCYAVAFYFVDRQLGQGRNFLFYTSVAIILTIHGLIQTGPTQLAVIVLWCLALVAAILGGLFDRITLHAHATLYLVTAATASGWLESSAGIVFSSGSDSQAWGFLLIGGATVATTIYVVLAMTRRQIGGRWWSRLPATGAALIATIGWGSIAILGIATALGLWADSNQSTAIARLMVVSAAAIVAAVAARSPRFSELAWICPMILVFGGARLLLVDVWNQPPGVLVFSFAFFGAALIITPKLLRTHSKMEEVAE